MTHSAFLVLINTRAGRQELFGGKGSKPNGGALCGTSEAIDRRRVQTAPLLRRIVVAIDPAVTSNADSGETGILVCGIADTGDGYVLKDLRGPYSPEGWARRAVQRITSTQPIGGWPTRTTAARWSSSRCAPSIRR